MDSVQNLENIEVKNADNFEKIPAFIQEQEINTSETYTNFATTSKSQKINQESFEPQYTTDYPQKYETFAEVAYSYQPEYKPTSKPYYHENQVYYTTTYKPTTTTYYTTSTTTLTATTTYTTTTTTYTTMSTTTTYTTSTTTTTYTTTTTTTTTAREYKPEKNYKEPEISQADPLNIPHYKTYMKPYYMTTQPPKPVIPYVPFMEPQLPKALSVNPLPILAYNRYESKHDPVIPYRETHDKTDAPNIPYYNYYKTYPTTTYTTTTTTYTTTTTQTPYTTPLTPYTTPLTTYKTPLTTYKTPLTTYDIPSTIYKPVETTSINPSTMYLQDMTEALKDDSKYKNAQSLEGINQGRGIFTWKSLEFFRGN